MLVLTALGNCLNCHGVFDVHAVCMLSIDNSACMAAGPDADGVQGVATAFFPIAVVQ